MISEAKKQEDEVALTKDQELEVEQKAKDYSAKNVAAAGGPQATFCADWPQAKQVLDFVKQFVPAPYNLAVAAIEEAGDIAHKIVCK